MGKKLKITNNAPVVLTFTLICLAAYGLNILTGGWTNRYLFSVYRSSLFNLLTWPRFFLHIFGHNSLTHLTGNLMLFIVIGPILEEKYGSANFIKVILITALTTGIVHFIFFPGTALLGASGVVFACILLASFTDMKAGSIPLTFIIVAILYVGKEIYQGLFVADDVSNLTHILGGAVGGVLGFVLNRKKTA